MLFSYVTISLLEYVVHRWLMHNLYAVGRFGLQQTYYKHSWMHHGRYFPPRNFNDCPDPASRFIGVSLSASTNVLWASPIWVGLYLVSPLGAMIFAVCVAAHACVWSVIHGEMHEPKNRWFAKLRIYKFWVEYHKTHHRRPKYNFNVVCPGADHVFGTYLGPQNGPIM